MESIAFVGAGNVGAALGLALARAGHRVVAVASRSQSSAQRMAAMLPGCRPCSTPQEAADGADIVFLTVPDDSIASVAESIRWRPGQGVVHCAGAVSVEALEPARKAGAYTGCFHPLQSFPARDEPPVLEGVTFALEGSAELLPRLQSMAESIGGRWLVLGPADRVPYHLGAVFLCNYLISLLEISAELWGRIGVSRQDAIAALLLLLRGTVDNIQRQGLPNCLTGPVARADLGTIRSHLTYLEETDSGLAQLYRSLGLVALQVAEQLPGRNYQKLDQLRQLLTDRGQTEGATSLVKVGG